MTLASQLIGRVAAASLMFAGSAAAVKAGSEQSIPTLEYTNGEISDDAQAVIAAAQNEGKAICAKIPSDGHVVVALKAGNLPDGTPLVGLAASTDDGGNTFLITAGAMGTKKALVAMPALQPLTLNQIAQSLKPGATDALFNVPTRNKSEEQRLKMTAIVYGAATGALTACGFKPAP